MLSRSSTSRVASGSSQAEGGRGLFSKVKQGIAHTSITGAFGNKDLRELQNLITEEKVLLQASTRTSNSFAATSAALGAWGASEGPDLADVCQRASEMLQLVAAGFEVFSGRQAEIRSLLKGVRTAEEELDDLKKRRRAVGSRSESEEKKLVKMSSENKNLPAQTELLQTLRNEMRELDTEIMDSEARLSDHKRVATKSALSLKFGGLLELAEKATIVGELGKLLIEEVPLETTPPGYGRGPYQGHDKTARLAEEASKCVSEVLFIPPQVALLPPSQSAVPPSAPQSAFLSGHEQDLSGSTQHNYEQFASGSGPSGPNGLHDDPTMLPLRFAGAGSASPTGQGSFDQQQQQQRDVGIGAPPISPAAAYRKSYQLGQGEPSPLAASATAGPYAPAARYDAYGNELPAGEGEGHEDAEHLDGLGAPLASPGLRTQSRPVPGSHRLTLGLGSDLGSGGLMDDIPERTSSRGGTPSPAIPPAPTTAPHVEAVPEISVQSPTAASSTDPYTLSPDGGNTSLPYAADEPSAIPPPSSDDHSVLQPPSAPFAQTQLTSPTSEKEAFVDAPESVPRFGSQPPALDQGRDSVDLDYYSNQYDEPPAPYQSPLPRPPQIIEPAPSSPSAYQQSQPPLHSQSSYSSARYNAPATPVSVTTSPSPAEPNMPRDEAELASAAAKREVEREMDSLAFSNASPVNPPVSPLEYAPRQGDSSARKINAGAFFKRNGAGGGPNSRSASFNPPANDHGDDGVSDDDASGTRPLRVGRNRPAGGDFEVGSPSRDAAPPYA